MMALIIFLVAFAYTTISTSVTNIFSNQKRIKEIQKTFSDIRVEFEAAMKAKDDAKLQVLEARQKANMPLLTEQLILMFKPLIILLPLLIVLLQEVRLVFPGFEITLPFPIPVVFQNFDKFPNWRDTFGAVGWFWISVLLSTIIISALKWVYGKYIAKTDQKEKKDPITQPVSLGGAS